MTAWKTAGCASFLPLIHSVVDASLSVAPKQTKVAAGGLACSYTRDGSSNAFGFGFASFGATAAIVQADMADAPSGWTACQVGTDASTQTALAKPILIAKLGTQAYEYDPCPGAAVVSDPGSPTNPDFAEGVVRVGATDYSASGEVTLKQMDTFLRQLIVKYP